MDEIADFAMRCKTCETQFRPKIQSGIVMKICPICKNTDERRLEILMR